MVKRVTSAIHTRHVVDCDAFITDIQRLNDIEGAFKTLTENPNAMKSMIRVTEGL